MSTYIIAEIGSVHDGSFGNATHLIDVAAQCGADAAKFQTHIASAETLRNAPMPSYFRGEPRYEYFERTGFTFQKWQVLKDHCQEKDVEFMSSPFSIEAVELLEKLGVSRYKIPSGEVTNLPMLDVIAQTGKPVLLSSGMSSWQELDQAVDTILKHHSSLTVLQCTSEYPCPYDQVGLNVMLEMKERYHLPVGLSDHTLTTYAPLAAVALGATVIEKHLTFSRLMYGSDARHSLTPDEFTDMVSGIRAVEQMSLSAVDKNSIEKYGEMKRIFEKSLVAITDIPAGTQLTRQMIGIKKPGTGLPPSKLAKIIGKVAVRKIEEGSLIQEDDLD
jgi:N,N'-diacetyllegionaminate synthase